MIKTVRDLIQDEFAGNRHHASQACNASVGFVNNLVSSGRAVQKLSSGDYLLVTDSLKTFTISCSTVKANDENMTVRQLVDACFDGDRAKAASAAEVTIAFLNNWISKDRTVIKLADGNFALETKTQKIFNVHTPYREMIACQSNPQAEHQVLEAFQQIAKIIKELRELESPTSKIRIEVVGTDGQCTDGGLNVTYSLLVGHYQGSIKTISDIIEQVTGKAK